MCRSHPSSCFTGLRCCLLGPLSPNSEQQGQVTPHPGSLISDQPLEANPAPHGAILQPTKQRRCRQASLWTLRAPSATLIECCSSPAALRHGGSALSRPLHIRLPPPSKGSKRFLISLKGQALGEASQCYLLITQQWLRRNSLLFPASHLPTQEESREPPFSSSARSKGSCWSPSAPKQRAQGDHLGFAIKASSILRSFIAWLFHWGEKKNNRSFSSPSLQPALEAKFPCVFSKPILCWFMY